MRICFLGLGKMGSRMVKKLLADGHEVVAWNRSQEPLEELAMEVKQANLLGFIPATSIATAVTALSPIRIVWSMLPAGPATETTLEEVSKYLSENDIVIDGGNSNYNDTERRSKSFIEKKIRFLGIGVSGGVLAEKNGFPLMAGGDKSAYDEIIPILDTFARPHGGHTYLGTGGAGHFVKMVHNGIEYGMMQAIGEGFEVLEKSPYTLDLLKVGKIWQKGSIVASFLIDRAVDALEKDTTLAHMAGPIAENGEAKWTIEAAKEEEVKVQVIADSLQFRQDTQQDAALQQSYTAKMVSALRFEFGGHEIKRK